MSKTKTPKERLQFDVAVTPPKPNPMFDEWQTAITKFLTYTHPVRCAFCGRMSKHHWTQLKFFRIAEGFEKKLPNRKVVEAQDFKLKGGTELFPPLTPVCGKHLLFPAL